MTSPRPCTRHAEIALLVGQMRREGASEDDIASRLRVTRHRLYHLVRAARAQGHDIPSVRTCRTPRWRRAAEMALAGMTLSDIAKTLNTTTTRVSQLLSYARTVENMDIPYAYGPPHAAQVLRNMQQKGALPGLGHLGPALESAPPDFGHWLARRFCASDGDVAHTLVRLVKESLHEPR